MRWLVTHPGPNFSVADVYNGWCEGLRDNGQQVSRYALDARLSFYDQVLLPVPGQDGAFRAALTDPAAVTERAVDGLYSHLYRWRPDVLLVVSGFFIPTALLDLARSYGTRVVLLCTEQPYELDRELVLAPHCDLVLLNDPTHLDSFRAVTRAEYVPHAYRPAVHHLGAVTTALGDTVPQSVRVAEPVHDFAFIGTGYPSRVSFLEGMAATGALDGLDVVLGGNWQSLSEASPLCPHVAHDLAECVDNQVAAEVYRGTRVGLNLYRQEALRPELADGWAMGPREVEMAACGLFYLRDPRGEGDELLPMLPTFTSPAEAAELLRWWLAHPDERETAATKAREAIADRTFDNHAARLLRWLTE